MKIMLAFDSFKESMTSIEAANAFEKGFINALPKTVFKKVLLSDGGEGFSEAFAKPLNGKKRILDVCNPVGKKVKASYWYIKKKELAIIEMAEASGLELIFGKDRNPLKTTTFGTGELILDAIKSGAKKIILGLGGSATNDGGTGMAQALGAEFFDENDKLISNNMCGGLLKSVKTINLTNLKKTLGKTKFVTACDVKNPFSGKKGAAYIYGPQKGASNEDLPILDLGLKNLAQVIKITNKKSINSIAGAGAAGGLGGGCIAFLNSELKSGIELLLDTIKFRKNLKGCKLLITGEGRIDTQTAYGKVLAGVSNIAKEEKIPVIAIGGSISASVYKTKKLTELFDSIYSLSTYPCDLPTAIKDGKINMQIAGETIASLLKIES